MDYEGPRKHEWPGEGQGIAADRAGIRSSCWELIDFESKEDHVQTGLECRVLVFPKLSASRGAKWPFSGLGVPPFAQAIAARTVQNLPWLYLRCKRVLEVAPRPPGSPHHKQPWAREVMGSDKDRLIKDTGP